MRKFLPHVPHLAGKLDLFPDTLPLQIVKIGSLALVAVPFELTTTAGRLLHQTVDTVLRPVGIRQVVIAGLANDYASYVTTPDEYDVQYYEGASTLFGKWTLDALRQEFRVLADSLGHGGVVGHGPEPGSAVGQDDTASMVLPRDTTPRSVAFGDPVKHRDADPSYQTGKRVSVTFWGANPNNDLRIQGTYLKVQRKDSTSWVTVANDWDWETRYHWKKHELCPGSAMCSFITIEWDIPKDAQPGIYRISHYGEWKDSSGRLHPYEGASREFRVAATPLHYGG
jgi:neutral ceramidase